MLFAIKVDEYQTGRSFRVSIFILLEILIKGYLCVGQWMFEL